MISYKYSVLNFLYTGHLFKKAYLIFFKKVPIKAMFTPTVFEILMSEGRLVLSPTQRGTGSERVKKIIEADGVITV